MPLRSSKLQWRKKIVERSNPWGLIEEENSLPKSYESFVKKMKLDVPWRFHDPPNRMLWRKEEIEGFLIWLKACSKERNCQNNFGQKLWHVQFIWPIDLQQEVYGERHHKKHGVKESLISLTWGFLGVEGQWDFETHENFLHLKKIRHLNMFSKSSPYQHQPLTKTLCHLLSVKGLCHTHEPSKIFMIKLKDWIISHYFFLFVDCEPVDFEEDAQDKRWWDVMDEEIRSIKKNVTCELVFLPKWCKLHWSL